MDNKVIKTIKERNSCRFYSDKKVPLGKVIQIAEAGKMAPSAVNRQICNILVLRKKNYVDKIKKLSIEIRGKDSFYGASTMIMVFGPKEDKFTIQDASCILENMFIAAQSLNIQSCWINCAEDLFMTPQGAKLKDSLGIPKDCMVVGTCILGYGNEKYSPVIKPRKEDFIKII